MPVIPALERLRPDDKFSIKTLAGSIASSRPP